MTLRVLHLGTLDKLASIRTALTTHVSPSNEAMVRQTLRRVCQSRLESATKRRDWLERKRVNSGNKGIPGMLLTLCDEEVCIAQSGLRRLDDNLNGALE